MVTSRVKTKTWTSRQKCAKAHVFGEHCDQKRPCQADLAQSLSYAKLLKAHSGWKQRGEVCAEDHEFVMDVTPLCGPQVDLRSTEELSEDKNSSLFERARLTRFSRSWWSGQVRSSDQLNSLVSAFTLLRLPLLTGDHALYGLAVQHSALCSISAPLTTATVN